MPELSAQLPAIIGEAAKSPLGIFALMIISLAILGFFFFKEASEKTRIAIFSMLFVGVAVFGLSIVRTTSAATAGSATLDAPAADADDDALVRSLLGTWTGDVVYFRPNSRRETFKFEMFGDQLVVRPTYLGSERQALNVKIGKGTIRFDVEHQEISGEDVTNILSSYIGVVQPDRINFMMTNSNGDPTTEFQLRRVESK